MIATFIILVLYACVSGAKDGVLWSRKGHEAFKWNEHAIFVVERCLFFSMPFVFPVMSYIGQEMSILNALIVTISAALCFSFWHNGFYYETRKRIDVKNYHFAYDSRNSTAKFEVNYFVRFMMNLAGIMLLVSYKYYLHHK